MGVQRSDILIYAGLTGICVLIFFPANFFVSWDLTHYLVYSRNFAEGLGFTDAAGNPASDRTGFVLLLSLLYKVFANSLFAVAAFECFWSVLFVTGLFALTQCMFDRRAAILAVSLFIISPAMINWLPRHLDAAWPALLLWSMYFIHDNRSSAYRILISAFLAVYAFWVKELAILFCALPLLAHLVGALKIRKQELIVFYVSCFVFVLLAMITSHFTATEISDISSGKAYGKSIGFLLSENANPIALLKYGFEGLWLYFVPNDESRSIYTSVPLLPAMGLSLLFSLFLVTRKSQSHTLLILAIVVFLPFAAVCGQLDLRPSQVLFLIACLYVALAAVVVIIVDTLFISSNRMKPVALLVVFLVLGVYQTTALTKNKATIKNLKNNNLVFRLFNEKQVFSARMRGKVLANWIKANVKPDEGVMIGQVAYQHGAAWLIPAKMKVDFVPYHQAARTRGWVYYDDFMPGSHDYHAVGIHRAHFKKLEPVVLMLADEVLRDAIRSKHTRYIIAAMFGVNHTAIPWLDRLDYLSEIEIIKDHGRKFKIYAVDSKALDMAEIYDEKPVIDRDLIKFIHHTRKIEGNHVPWYQKNVLQEGLNFDKPTITSLRKYQESELYEIVP